MADAFSLMFNINAQRKYKIGQGIVNKHKKPYTCAYVVPGLAYNSK